MKGGRERRGSEEGRVSRDRLNLGWPTFGRPGLDSSGGGSGRMREAEERGRSEEGRIVVIFHKSNPKVRT